MRHLIIALLAIAASCSSQQSEKEQENKKANDTENLVVIMPLNNGSKWKADEATKKNIAAMMQIVRDSTYQNAGKRKELIVVTQNQVDTLIKQCSMKGDDHNALHMWVEKILMDVKELKDEEGDEYDDAFAALKKDVEDFYAFFE